MDHNFKDLLKRYLANQASPEECDELMRLINNGGHASDMDTEFEKIFDHGSHAEGMDPARASDILHRVMEPARQTRPARVARSVVKLWRWAAAAFLIVCCSLLWWVIRDEAQPVQLARETTAPERITVTEASNAFVRLPDGTTVILNKGSELSYTRSYGTDTREVTLTGEAYFDVQHDAAHPFVVLSGKIKTEVLGTAFNVKAYAGQPEVIVTVTRGKVQVFDDTKKVGVITPDEQLAVNTTTHEVAKTVVDVDADLKWTNRFLILDNVTLEAAAAILTEKYNVKVIFANNTLKKCMVTATFLNGETIEHVLTVLGEVHQAEYTIDADGNVVISGSGCQ